MMALRFLLTLVFLFGNSLSSLAYDKETHSEIARQSVQSEVSSLDKALKGDLGLPEGTKEKLFRGTSEERTVERLIRDGAKFEDFPDTRVFNHFHNPLASQWEDAGLRAFLGTVRGQSSVLWQQNINQNLSLVFMPAPFPSLGGNWSWQDTRKRYLDALTGETKEQRDQAFADTFLGLGHLIHLVQDASVPAHVRNDPHPGATVPSLGSKIGNPDWYEDWVKQTREESPSLFQSLLGGTPIRPSLSIFTATANAQAPVPVARLIDTDKLLGLNFSVLTDPELGISEYTNGNFLSRDTIFTDFDLPRQTSLDPNFIVEPVGAKFRRYLQKVSEGETVRHFVTEGLLYRTLEEAVGAGPVPAGGWTLDDEHVHVDYAAKLLPRAVGYSAALLDYFFRESLQVERMYWESTPWSGGVYIDIRNQAAEEAEGVFDLYAIYDKGTEGERREKFAALNGGTSVKVRPHASRRFQLDVPPDHRLTPDYVLVFRGRLGGEEDAVVGQVFMVPHIIVVQEGYHADLGRDCRRIDQEGLFFPPSPGGTYVHKTARLRCEWKAANHTLSGRILTNSRSPIIERIEARWWGRTPGLAPLTIGEQTYAGVWQREGTEPDPERFSIVDPASRDRSTLFLTILLKGGQWIDTSLATFDTSISVHGKDLVVNDPRGGGIDYLVTSGRSVSPTVAYNWYSEGVLQYPFFQATSISGYPNPTDTVTYRRFASMGFGEGVLVTPFMFLASVIDDFKTIPSGASKPSTDDPAFQAAEQLFNAIEPLKDPQTHEGPFITWQAEVARVYQPMEREFLRMVMTTEPPPFTIPLSGTQQ